MGDPLQRDIVDYIVGVLIGKRNACDVLILLYNTLGSKLPTEDLINCYDCVVCHRLGLSSLGEELVPGSARLFENRGWKNLPLGETVALRAHLLVSIGQGWFGFCRWLRMVEETSC